MNTKQEINDLKERVKRLEERIRPVMRTFTVSGDENKNS